MATLKDEISKLKSQIVESPEELKNEMEKMKENVKSIKLSKVCIFHTLGYVKMCLRQDTSVLIAQINRSLFSH